MSVPGPLLDALRELTSRRPVLVALDFDGVLAPIVPVAEDARALPEAVEAVRRLLAADAHVAMVSGRHLAGLREVAAPPPGVLLVGSHGAEVDGAPGPQVDAVALERVSAALEAVARTHPGTRVEAKSAAAVLHTRQADPDVARSATRDALEAVAGIDGAEAMLGKQVVDVSVVRADKGTAVNALRERLGAGAVLFAGDDVTDENAFTALDPATDVGLKVGDGETAATHRVGSPQDVAEVLDVLADLLAQDPARR